MSNRDRIQRLQAEAAATAHEKEGKAAASAKRRSSRSKVAVPQRMKIVWAVCDPKGKIVKTFPYPLKPAAEAEALRLGDGFRVRDHRVPMDE